MAARAAAADLRGRRGNKREPLMTVGGPEAPVMAQKGHLYDLRTGCEDALLDERRTLLTLIYARPCESCADRQSTLRSARARVTRMPG